MNNDILKKTVVVKTCIEGGRVKYKDSYVKIMAVKDGYVMARHKGCIPFIVSEKDFIDKYIPDPLFRGDEEF